MQVIEFETKHPVRVLRNKTLYHTQNWTPARLEGLGAHADMRNRCVWLGVDEDSTCIPFESLVYIRCERPQPAKAAK